MSDDSPADHLRRASLAAQAARSATSPEAVESALASVSAEVMEEAIARRERAAKGISTL
jgi:hypothetical protein